MAEVTLTKFQKTSKDVNISFKDLPMHVVYNVMFVLHSQAGTNLAVLMFSLTATFQTTYSVTDHVRVLAECELQYFSFQ